MPIKYKSNCATCQLIKKDPELKRRFYTSTYYDKQGREPLSQIVEDLLPYTSRQSIYNHARKHGDYYFRKRSDRDETIKQFRERERKTKEALGTLKVVAPEMVLEGEVINPTAEAEETWEDALDELIRIGAKDLRKGHMKVNAGQLVTALKVKADREAAKGSQQQDFIEAMAIMAMGKPTS